MRRPILMTCLLLSACTQFPELDRAISEEARTADYPDLEDPDTLLAQAEGGSDWAAVESDLTGRADALRQRGAALDAGGVDDATRLRMAEGRDRIAQERTRLSQE